MRLSYCPAARRPSSRSGDGRGVPGPRGRAFQRAPKRPARTPKARPKWPPVFRPGATSRNRGKTAGSRAVADEARQAGDGGFVGNIESGGEIVPEGDAELAAGLDQPE